ncbi:MAG: hypothetical protein IK102_11395 [Treponema sp.]|nr:hypothetical protein [Treponema sp.]
MDDKEYYSLMNRSSSWSLQQALKKKKSDTGSTDKTKKASPLPGDASTYAGLELRQGSADAQMLMEKQQS